MIFLGIGSNLNSKFGNRFLNIKKTLDLILYEKIKIKKISSFYETPSYPNLKNPRFINIVIQIEFNLSPENLLKKILFIENKMERTRSLKNEPRTCDIDIIDYDKKIIKATKSQNLTIPHPKMHKRNFVLLPLFEIAKTWIHPLKKTSIKDLINALDAEDLRTIKLI